MAEVVVSSSGFEFEFNSQNMLSISVVRAYNHMLSFVRCNRRARPLIMGSAVRFQTVSTLVKHRNPECYRMVLWNTGQCLSHVPAPIAAHEFIQKVVLLPFFIIYNNTQNAGHRKFPKRFYTVSDSAKTTLRNCECHFLSSSGKYFVLQHSQIYLYSNTWCYTQTLHI